MQSNVWGAPASGRKLARCGALALTAALLACAGGAPAPRSVNYLPDPGARWFKGNTHAHTTNSDGDSPPEVVTRWYQEHGYAFLVLSDHNYLTKEGSFPYEKREGFLLVQGEEVSATYRAGEKGPKKSVHVNALDLKEVIEPYNGKDALETVNENVRRVRAANAVPHVNHPNYMWAISNRDLLAAEGFKLLEIFNGHPLVNTFGGGDSPGMEAVWDELLTAGKPVYGIAVDDAHDFTGEFAPNKANPGRGWVCVRAKELAPHALMEALERGDFYASTGVTLRDVAVVDGALAISIAREHDSKYTTRFIGEGGRVLATCPALECRYAFRPGDTYVRARVDDSRGRSAWVQPVILRTLTAPRTS